MWYVVTSFYDTGKVKAYLLSQEEYTKHPPKPPGEYKKFDLYIDSFETRKEAELFRDEALTA